MYLVISSCWDTREVSLESYIISLSCNVKIKSFNSTWVARDNLVKLRFVFFETPCTKLHDTFQRFKDISDVFFYLRGKSFWYCWLLQYESSQARINCEFVSGRLFRKEGIGDAIMLEASTVPGRIVTMHVTDVNYNFFIIFEKYMSLNLG